MTDEAKAWLAGFIDGEGYIGLTFQIKRETPTSARSPRYHPYLIITNTHKAVIEYIQILLGVGRVYNFSRKNIKFKNAYQIKISQSNDLQAVLTAILPYLRVKSEQARIVLDFLARRSEVRLITGRGHRGVTSFGEADRSLYQRLLDLNKTGQ